MEKQERINVSHFCTYYDVDITFIRSLHDAGLVSLDIQEDENFLDYEELGKLEKFVRLHHDLSINTAGIEAISHLLEKMEFLQQEITNLKNRLGIYES
jgi:chaperone modulatory protein CbpM